MHRAVWTWGRNDDLRFLPKEVRVAAVDTAVELQDTRMYLRPGTKQLQLAPGATLLPVVHVDALSRWRAALNQDQQAKLVDVILRVLNRHGGEAVQIDFEALPSQRAFYLAVLTEVRQRAPHAWLSATALTSWCYHDKEWLAALPVDEVVPMAFRLGRDAPRWRERLAQATTWPSARCTATGIATDEPPLKLPMTPSIYYFSPTPWSPEQWHLAKKRIL